MTRHESREPSLHQEDARSYGVDVGRASPEANGKVARAGSGQARRSDPFESQDAEGLLLGGHFRGAEAECRAILGDNYVKLDAQLHKCTVIALIQALFEQKRVKNVDGLIASEYGGVLGAPVEVFEVWFQLQVSLHRYDAACNRGIEYLSANKSKMSQQQYDDFIELLVFHALVELGEHRRALKFLKKNQNLSADKKEAFIRELQRLIAAAEEPAEETSAGAVAEQGAAVNGDGKATESDQRPAEVKSNLASRGFLARVGRMVAALLKRARKYTPVVYTVLLVAVVLLIARRAASAVRFKAIRAEAIKFLSLFFALGPSAV